jgi:hypothetical protein
MATPAEKIWISGKNACHVNMKINRGYVGGKPVKVVKRKSSLPCEM